jgi:hypothetical protein
VNQIVEPSHSILCRYSLKQYCDAVAYYFIVISKNGEYKSECCNFRFRWTFSALVAKPTILFIFFKKNLEKLKLMFLLFPYLSTLFYGFVVPSANIFVVVSLLVSGEHKNAIGRRRPLSNQISPAGLSSCSFIYPTPFVSKFKVNVSFSFPTSFRFQDGI